MDRFLRVWGLRSVVLIAFVLAVPVSHVSAQGAAGVAVQAAAPAAQQEPADPDLGPSNEALSPEEEARAAPADVSPSEVTGVSTSDPNAPSPLTLDQPESRDGGD
jgi:hypothetical protein